MYSSRHVHPGQGIHEPMLLSPRTNLSGSPVTPNTWSMYHHYPMGMNTARTAHKPLKPAPPSEAPEWAIAHTHASYSPVAPVTKTKKLLTLAYVDKESVWTLPETFAEVEEIAHRWIQPPDGVKMQYRIPAEYASVIASRLVHGPYLWIPNDETYQIAIDRTNMVRIEIIGDLPPPPDIERPETPPPQPVFEMPCDFDLELAPGQRVTLGTICNSEDLDMSRSEDGTLVDGTFWGCIKITHTEDQHAMVFTGSRVVAAASPMSDSGASLGALPMLTSSMDYRTAERFALATRPSTVKCSVRISAPKDESIEVGVAFSPMWSLTNSFPPAEPVEGSKARWFIKVKPGGIIEHPSTGVVASELFYEATPDTSAMALSKFITPSNSFALPVSEFMLHISKVLDSLGLSLHARSAFLSANFPAFSSYRNIAYRFMPPKAINRAIELWCTQSQVHWMRIFFMWRGVSDEEIHSFPMDRDKDWRSVVEWKPRAADAFSVVEVSAIECT